MALRDSRGIVIAHDFRTTIEFIRCISMENHDEDIKRIHARLRILIK